MMVATEARPMLVPRRNERLPNGRLRHRQRACWTGASFAMAALRSSGGGDDSARQQWRSHGSSGGRAAAAAAAVAHAAAATFGARVCVLAGGTA